MRVSYTCHINGIGVCMAKGPPRHPPPKPANAKAARALVHLRARRGSRPTPLPPIHSGPGGRVGTADQLLRPELTARDAARTQCDRARATHRSALRGPAQPVCSQFALL